MQSSLAQQNIVDRLFGWWYKIATPRAPSYDASLQAREQQRKAQFTSIILLIELVNHLFTLAIQINTQAYVAIAITTIMMIVGIILNRLGKTLAAGIVALVTTEVGMCLGIVSTAFVGGGLPPDQLQTFSILVQPDLIAISLFSAAVALPLGLFNCLFTAAALTFLPKTPELAHLFVTSRFDMYFQPISLQIVVILVSLFWASSTSVEMKRANRAEEVNKLSQALAAQQQNAMLEKQQLEESIQQIVAVHMQVANGDFNARVPLDRGNVLWSIAGSLNNLLSRVQRWRQEAQQLQRTEQAAQQALYVILQAKKQGAAPRLQKTGTALDPLLAEITEDISSYH